MDSNIFANVNSILEVYTLSAKLKEQGEDAAEVNRLATNRKKELVKKANEINSLKKIVPKASDKNRSQVTKFPLRVVSLNSGHIKITADNVVEL